MLKKIILTILLVVSVMSVALAKDGPFPMFAAAGTWRAVNLPGLTVKIELGQKVSEGRFILVALLVQDSSGKILVHGRSFHNMSDSNLVVDAVDIYGRPVRVTVTQIDTAAFDRPQASGLHLVMTIQDAKTGESYPNYVLDR